MALHRPIGRLLDAPLYFCWKILMAPGPTRTYFQTVHRMTRNWLYFCIDEVSDKIQTRIRHRQYAILSLAGSRNLCQTTSVQMPTWVRYDGRLVLRLGCCHAKRSLIFVVAVVPKDGTENPKRSEQQLRPVQTFHMSQSG